MIDYFEKIDFNQRVYTLSSPPGSKSDNDIYVEPHTWGDLVSESPEMTTTPHGIAPRYYVDGTALRSWGYGGNNDGVIAEFETAEQAAHALLLCHLYDFQRDENAPTIFDSRAEAEFALTNITGDVADA
jgi:hypothetical protein